MLKHFSVSLSLTLFTAVIAILDPTNSSTAPKQVTFTKDVAPILFKSCAQCHRPGESGPFSVLSYKEVRPWAKSIKEKVGSREMPPWHADPHFGVFANNTSLSRTEIDTIIAWVDSGAKEGKAADLPATPRFSSGWAIGKPDLTFTMKDEYRRGNESVDELVNIRVPIDFPEDRWIQAAEFQPGTSAIVHHGVVFVETPQMYEQAKATARRKGITDPDKIPTLFDGINISSLTRSQPVNDACAKNLNVGGNLLPILCVYVPGGNVQEWPAGAAKFVPKGSHIILQMHYNKTAGQPASDRSSVGLKFASTPVEREVKTMVVLNPLFMLPANSENVEVNACHTSQRDMQIIGYMPHMHLRGKDMKFEAVLPDGNRQTLLQINKYDFNWQTFYRLKEPLALPKGTRLMTTAHFDNSIRNRRNPNPGVDVRFGQETKDEMMVIYIDAMTDVGAARASR